ncbi:MAG: DUF2793 domain-containing protein [Pseudomonadota bacterium]
MALLSTLTTTPHLDLPLVAAAQAQKHVTVNEALQLVDLVAQLSVLSATLADPPSEPTEGDRYLLPASATGAWAGQGGKIAAWCDGWLFLTPQIGWTAFVQDAGETRRFESGAWQLQPGGDTLAKTSSGASVRAQIASVDMTLSAGGAQSSPAFIPDRSVVIGVTARVISPLAGPGTWRLGTPDSDTRYGSGLGTTLNSFAHGITGSPIGYYGATSLLVSPEGADFSAGTIRLAAHYFSLSVPDPV